MKRTIIATACVALLSACTTTSQQTGFQLSGEIEGLQAGDTLLLTEIIMPRWEEVKSDTLIVKQADAFSVFIPMEHTTYYLLTHKPKVGKPIQSCIRGEEVIARVGDNIHITGELEYLGALRHSGGLYDDMLVAKRDSLVALSNTEMIEIYQRCMKYRSEQQMDSAAKYAQMYNNYRAPKEGKIYRDSLVYKVHNSEYAAYMYIRHLHDVTYTELKERLELFTPEIRTSYFGQILTKQMATLKNIEVGQSPKDFTLTDNQGKKISLSDYKGKYVLIYHWGLCPGTFWVNPRIMELYEKYHDKGFEVLGLTSEDLKQSLETSGSWESLKDEENIKGLLAHPWTTAYTKEPGNEYIEDELYLSGVPLFTFVSPEGMTLVRGYTDQYENIKQILEKKL